MTTAAILNPNLDATTYHERVKGVASKSALDRIARSPSHYLAWLDGQEESTPAMEFGRLVHRYVLETPKCLDEVAVQPDFGDCRKKENKQARDAWAAENVGKLIVSTEDWDLCRRIGDAVHKNPIAAKILERGQAEISAFWQDADTGIDCKARLDWWRSDLGIIADLKTTADASPKEFARSVGNFRYHVQAAFYLDGLKAIGEPAKSFAFIAVEKEPPFAVAIYCLDDVALERGRELYRRDLATLRACLESDTWPSYTDRVTTLSLPSWNLRD